MTCNDATMSLGVYLIGALDPAERAAVDEHLRGCAKCRRELDDLAMLPSVLDKLSPEDLDEVIPLPEVSEGLFEKVAARARAEADEGPVESNVRELRRRPRWRTAIAAAAAAVIVVGGATTATVALLGSSKPAPAVAIGAAGAVHMQVAFSSQATGTALRVTVSGLPEDEHCRLFAVSRDGTWDLVGRWDATYAGQAQVTGSTAIPAADLEKFVLRGDGGEQLVTAPV